jgi:hypothetical protein
MDTHSTEFVLLSLNFSAGCGELVALAILSPAIWMRLCCFVGAANAARSRLSGGFWSSTFSN